MNRSFAGELERLEALETVKDTVVGEGRRTMRRPGIEDSQALETSRRWNLGIYMGSDEALGGADSEADRSELNRIRLDPLGSCTESRARQTTLSTMD